MANTGKMLMKLGAGLAAALVLAPALLMAQGPVKDVKRACAVERLKDSVKVGEYLFRTYESDRDDGTCFQVSRQGRVIFRRTDDWFRIGQAADKEYGIPAIPNGTDITGRGHPDMIVSASTGGAHCCVSHYVFELEPKFRLLATVQDEDDELAHFERDGEKYYLHTADWTFAYWWMSFAGSPNHSVILRYVDDEKGGGFHLAWDKMRTPAPTPEEWQKALRKVRHELALEQKGSFNFLPSVLWQEILNLLYTGHSDLAWKFLDEVGPRAQQGNYPDLADFCSKLKTSLYWKDLAPTLGNVPKACADAKPTKD